MRLGIACLCVLIILFLATLANAADTPNTERALVYVSQKHNTPLERLIVANEGYAEYPLIGTRVWCGKILDVKTGSVYGVCFDESGNFVDIREMELKERTKYAEKYGKLEVELYNILQKMDQNDTIKIGIWLKVPEIKIQKPTRIDDEIYNKIIETKKNIYKQAEDGIVRYLSAKGVRIIYTSQYAPLVFAEVSKKILSEIEQRDDVAAIYLSRTYKPELDSAAYTEKANVVWSRGITGNGVKIAVVEADGIAFANPYLADGSYFDSSNPNVGAHATAVAGVIESTHSTYKGVAYGAPALLSANSQTYSDSDIINAVEWALDSGANIISNSWGIDTGLQLSSMDRYFDHIVWSHYKTVIKSAGNEGTESGNVTSPGLGYNMITVGAIDDKDTSTWSDDAMAPYSSYKDPISPHGDREKPEVVAVGSRMRSTTTSSPWVGYVGSGTSFAAPSIAAEAALLMQRESWLKYWPETVKAIVMASAVHNIEGSNRLSEYDGAGAIDCSKADDTARYGYRDADVLYKDDFPKYYTFSASAGQRVRVVISWDSHPDNNHPPSTDPLESDLDLVIYDPNGNYVTSSTSWDNNYEIVEFTAQTSGTYKAKVTAYRFDGSYEYLGFAYSFK